MTPPRPFSTSDQVERLAKGADIIVHSAIHPIMGPEHDSGMYPYAYYRQSNVFDLGAMGQRTGAKHLMLTHLIPPLGADRQGPFKVPGGALTEAAYRRAAEDGGFTGNIVVGTDLASLQAAGRPGAVIHESRRPNPDPIIDQSQELDHDETHLSLSPLLSLQ